MEKKACILNSVIIILEVVALTWMISGITDGALSIAVFFPGIGYTVDKPLIH